MDKDFLVKVNNYAESYIRPKAGEFDKNCSLSKEVIRGLAQLGILGSTVPEKYGGINLDPLTYGRMTEMIGKACSASRTLLTVHTALVCETLVKMANDVQKDYWLPKLSDGTKIGCFALSEPTAGSDANSIKTSYVLDGNQYILNGKKKWISFAEIADFFVVIATDGKAITAFMLEKEMSGLIIKPMRGLLGSRASHTAELHLNNVKVPKENIIGQEGSGFSFVVNTALFNGRYSIAWGGLGLATSALEEMSRYSRKRKQFGVKIGNHQLIKSIIGQAVTDVHAGRALCERAGRLKEEMSDQAIIETNIAKYFTSKAAVKITSDVVQVFGGNGCIEDYPAERLYRDSKILEIIEGTSQIQEVMLGNYGLKKYGR
ncbi:acyl-CoA dehydrogenase family protein [Salipaludibacillus agaradhaerens]|uniref:acyl-CoA dehydrogenase family protein n=1 Tax=Salipaludibacillus agaradhaerens TaxID=76935 RepID=UPI00215156A7|nr:acyl-CoA dehydrogenase family protein [Salipaludibacillus agaradhaerens]MCR6105816.1 acyl-CoA dehydrogenase family protein [Salipaludibacillus agaradhaerens]MCR6117852.1 acyl-CoA dehydrogenase family protein [Salipaludibacillus agaradhaerens]